MYKREITVGQRCAWHEWGIGALDANLRDGDGVLNVEVIDLNAKAGRHGSCVKVYHPSKGPFVAYCSQLIDWNAYQAEIARRAHNEATYEDIMADARRQVEDLYGPGAAQQLDFDWTWPQYDIETANVPMSMFVRMLSDLRAGRGGPSPLGDLIAP